MVGPVVWVAAGRVLGSGVVEGSTAAVVTGK